jgi:hypothetical protein
MRFAGMALDGGNYISAASNATGDADSILGKNSPRFDTLSATAGKTRGDENISAMQAQANVMNAGMASLADTQSAAFGAAATKAQGEASASATRAQGMSNMIGSIAGGVSTGFSKSSGIGGDWKDASDIGFKGNQVNDLGRLRY